jgi:hypothetical protein
MTAAGEQSDGRIKVEVVARSEPSSVSVRVEWDGRLYEFDTAPADNLSGQAGLDAIARLICDFMNWPEDGPAWDDAHKLARQVHEPAYKQGWSDREADILERAERIPPAEESSVGAPTQADVSVVAEPISEAAKAAAVARWTGPSHFGSTSTGDVLATAADMLDEMAQRLGGLADTPVIARKLRELRAVLAAQADLAPARAVAHVDDLNDPILKALANPEPNQCHYCLERDGKHMAGCDVAASSAPARSANGGWRDWRTDSPPDDERVLVLIDPKRFGVPVWIDRFDAFVGAWRESETTSVLGWQPLPLPTPPKAEAE